MIVFCVILNHASSLRALNPRFTPEILKFQKSKLSKFIPNFSLKHVITSTNPPVATGVCNPNKSWARHHRSLKLGSKLKYHNRKGMHGNKNDDFLAQFTVLPPVAISYRFNDIKICSLEWQKMRHTISWEKKATKILKLLKRYIFNKVCE